MTSPGPLRPTGRLESLDALRGIAALIVVLHHVSMAIPVVSDSYEHETHVHPFDLGWWAVASPFKVLVAGPELVLVFFVLSGFVLTRSVVRHRPYDWWAYYPRRVLRLGIPVVAAVVVGLALLLVLPRVSSPGDDGWLSRQQDPDLSPLALLRAATLLTGQTYPDLDPPLWSLRWEMWFSLLLPAGVLVALAGRRWWAPIGAALCVVSALGYVENTPAATYLTVFALGGLVAVHEGELRALGDRMTGRRELVWALALVAGVALMVCYWWVRFGVDGSEPSNSIIALRVPGALLVVLAAGFWPRLRAALSVRPLLWLGRISFSLYLVHYPVVIGLAGYGRNAVAQGLLAAAGIPVSLALAWAFWWGVERPSQALASRAGRAVSVLGTRLRMRAAPAGRARSRV